MRAFVTAIKSMSREKWINFLCIMTIATGMFLIAVGLLVLYNIDLATKRLPERFSVTVYLSDKVSAEQTQKILGTLKDDKAVGKVRYISKDDALAELKSVMKDTELILEGLDENPLPASFVVKLRREAVSGGFVKEFAEKISKVSGVSDVQYGEKLLEAIQAIKSNTEGVGLALALMISAGLLFVIYSSVKILFYRRLDEIDTLKLLGATKGFIRAPFLFEGAVLGVLGGLISGGAVAAAKVFIYKGFAYLPILRSVVIPVELIYGIPLAGLVLGVMGAYMAVGNLKL